MVASQEGHIEVVKLLVEHGVNVNTPNSSGYTPVYVAAYNGHAEIVRTLASAGAHLDQVFVYLLLYLFIYFPYFLFYIIIYLFFIVFINLPPGDHERTAHAHICRCS